MWQSVHFLEGIFLIRYKFSEICGIIWWPKSELTDWALQMAALMALAAAGTESDITPIKPYFELKVARWMVSFDLQDVWYNLLMPQKSYNQVPVGKWYRCDSKRHRPLDPLVMVVTLKNLKGSFLDWGIDAMWCPKQWYTNAVYLDEISFCKVDGHCF